MATGSEGRVGAGLLMVSVTLMLQVKSLAANSPPRFLLDTNVGSEIVLRLREGPHQNNSILRLRGYDPDGDDLQFGVTGVDSDLVQVVRRDAYTGDLFLTRELDHELQSELSLLLTLTDGHLGEDNFITQPLLILVEDSNDNSPVFVALPGPVRVLEHHLPEDDRAIAQFRAEDRDSGAFGQVVYGLAGGQQDEVYHHFSVTTDREGGSLRLKTELDYEAGRLYQVVVEAKDRASLGQANTAQATLIVEVEDSPDQPPEWVTVPAVTRIQEDVPLFTPVGSNGSGSGTSKLYYKHVLQVKAVDGDRSINNAIEYSITAGPDHIFGINKNTGTVYSKAIIDRESEEAVYGTFIMQISATEVDTNGNRGQSVLTEVTIIVTDVNDEIPRFRSSSYVGEIAENSQRKTPVTLVGDAIAEVFDHDQGTNGTFNLILEDDTGLFEVSPSKGINEASFYIRVKDSARLDFEAIKVVNMTLVAREVVEGGRESRVGVVVYLRDQNDNTPVFSQESYEVWVGENLQPGGVIARLAAEDEDSGVFGTEGIRFMGLQGSISRHLQLDSRTGVVSLATSGGFTFNREERESHHLTVEVSDGEGKGNTNTVALVIHLMDINDNAPVFSSEKYESFLLENSRDFKVPLVVTATDQDQAGSENAEVRYVIVDGDPGGNFTIDSETGEIKPHGVLDYEQIPGTAQAKIFNLTVRGFDLGSPSLSSDVSVVIYLVDRNDNPPVFSRLQYTVSIPEDTPGLTPVLQVVATDSDGSSPNNQLVYRIQAGAKDKFVINTETGMISVSEGANLDPDLTLPSTLGYLLEVVAIDGGVGSDRLTGWTSVIVNVTDVNNKPPRMSSPPPVVVREDVEVGSVVARLTAVDPDTGAQLSYSLDTAHSIARSEQGRLLEAEMFTVDQNSGEVVVSTPLDRETVAELELRVVVEDVAAVGERQVALTSLHISVEDVNDNSPVFVLPEYSGLVTENSPPATNILSVRATDADVNKTIKYSIQGSRRIKRLVRIDEMSGEIKVRGNIDRETQDWLNFTVSALDGGTPLRRSEVNVSLMVLDENDNSPVITSDSRTVQVSEDTQPGNVITVITATDADIGDFGTVTYLLDSKAGEESVFSIDPQSGEITLTRSLDRETREVFTLLVQAWDNYQHGYSAGQSRNSWAQLTVIVTDVNDQAPEFEEVDVECVSVSEFQKRHEPILTVRARDEDDPESPNSEIQFGMKGGDALTLFRVETVGRGMGRVYPATSLKGKYGNYSVTVVAEDGGVPPNVREATYQVCVQDFNDNAPQFVFPSSNHTIRVPENATIGTEVITVRAVDTDIGSNGLVSYTIRKDPLGNHKTFSIDSVTGVITLTKPLDRERQKIYELRVEAGDSGVPTPLQSDLDLTILVRNVNDHQPQFIVDQFKVNFTENKPAGQERVKIINTVDLDDENEDDIKTDVCYFVVGNNQAGLFDVNPYTHDIMTTKALDREEKDSHLIIIKATEECHQKPEQVTEFDPSDDSLLEVVVYINDQNDNNPQFSQDMFTGGISTDIDFGTAFMKVHAVDADYGINADLEYYICSKVTPIVYEGMELNATTAFAMNPVTGEIVLNFDPQRNQKGYFGFDVCVRDIGGKTDKAEVYIYLLREDQRVKFVLRNHPEEIRARLLEFRSILADITSSIVNVDQIKVHENVDGTVDKTKTDVLLHFVNPDDNTIIEAVDVIQALDYNTEQLDPFFKEYNVLQTEAAAASLLSEKSSPEMVVILWLVGVVVFLVITLIVVICICLSQSYRYNRKLRAATTAAFGSQAASDIIVKSESVVPNTNRHAMEGSNPVWMTGYDNWQVEEEEDEEEESGKEENFDNFDSLDANVLNESYEEGSNNNRRGTVAAGDDADSDVPDHLRGDVLYRGSYHSGGGSTLLMNSAKDLDPDHDSQSSGRGSSSRAGSAQYDKNKFGSINRNLSALFPAGMPPVEKLNNPLASSRLTLHGYEDVSIPRTEL